MANKGIVRLAPLAADPRATTLAAVTQVVVLTVLVAPVAYWMAYPGRGQVLEDVLTAWISALALGFGAVLRLGPRDGTSLGLLLGAVVGLALAAVLGFTPMRGFGLLLPPTIGLALGLLDGIGRQMFEGFKQGILVAMSIGFAIGLGLVARQGWTVLAPALLIGLVIGTLIGMRLDPLRGWRGGLRRPPWWLLALVIGLSGGMMLLLRMEFMNGGTPTVMFGLPPAWAAFWFTVMCLLLAPIGCFSLGSVLGSWLRPRFEVFGELVQYLRAMYVPIGAFALGYSLILLVFSGFYGSLYRMDPAHFGSPDPEPGRIEWLFFALYSAVGTAYSSLKPISPLANATVAAQSLLGVGWAVVVFAAVMSHLQPRLAAISERVHSKLEGGELEGTELDGGKPDGPA